MTLPYTPIDLRHRAPLTRKQLQQLQHDVNDLRGTAKRKGTTLDAWDEYTERSAARDHFDLGCWLYHYTTLRGLTPEQHLQARVNVLVRLFLNEILHPGYRFFTAFDFGERTFDRMFEQGDSHALIDALRTHLVTDSTGRLAKSFDSYGWPKERTE